MEKKIEYQKCEATPNIAKKMREYTDHTLSIYDDLINYIEARAKLGECAISIGNNSYYDSVITRLSNEGFLITKEDSEPLLKGSSKKVQDIYTINW